MTDYNNTQLRVLAEQVARQKHLETRLKDLALRKTELTRKVRILDAARRNEEIDVERLEGHSLAAFSGL